MQKNTQPTTPAASVTVTLPATRQLSPLTREKISLSKTKITKAHLMSSAVEYLNEILNAPPEDKRLPTVAGFCLAAGISRSRLYELGSVPGEVADIIEYIGLLQEDRALTGGMNGKTHPIFSMFLLKSKHGYTDSAPTLNQTNNFNVTPELLADAIQIMNEKKNKRIEE